MAAEKNGGKTLDERVRLIEDRLDIYNLIASHPPSADTGAGALEAQQLLFFVSTAVSVSCPCMPLTPALSPQAGRGRACSGDRKSPSEILSSIATAFPRPACGERDRVRGIPDSGLSPGRDKIYSAAASTGTAGVVPAGRSNRPAGSVSK